MATTELIIDAMNFFTEMDAPMALEIIAEPVVEPEVQAEAKEDEPVK